MPPGREIDLDPEGQAILRAWRLLVSEHYSDDIQHLQGNPGIIHGFEIAHHLICEYEELRIAFHLNPTRFHDLGHQVMREQFDQHMVRMRPVIRVVDLDADYRRRIDTLRMRDRNKVVSIGQNQRHLPFVRLGHGSGLRMQRVQRADHVETTPSTGTGKSEPLRDVFCTPIETA